MIEGKTSTGFKFAIDENNFNDMEFIEVLKKVTEIETENNASDYVMLLPDIIKFMFDEKQKKALYDHCRNEKGKVPLDRVNQEVMEIIAYNGKESEDVKN